MKKNTFVLTLLGTLGAIALTVIYALILTGASNAVFTAHFGDRSAFAILENTIAYIAVSFFTFEIIFFVWLFSSLARDKTDAQNSGLLGGKSLIDTKNSQKKKITKSTKISILAGILILVCMLIANFTIYTEVTSDTICKHTLFSSKEYSYSDVYRYSLSCDESATLKFTIQMRDGTSFELLQSTNTCSDSFSDEYGDMLSFVGHLTEKLENSDRAIPKSIVGMEYMEKFYSSSDATWSKISKIIGEQQN